jgi:hypothetical protein
MKTKSQTPKVQRPKKSGAKTGKFKKQKGGEVFMPAPPWSPFWAFGLLAFGLCRALRAALT